MVELKINLESPEAAANLVMVLIELGTAVDKYPTWPECNIKRSAIVLEEAGELIREANLLDEGRGSISALKTECIQTAAMSLRMLNALSKDDHARGNNR